jgi:hypothetical protein
MVDKETLELSAKLHFIVSSQASQKLPKYKTVEEVRNNELNILAAFVDTYKALFEKFMNAQPVLVLVGWNNASSRPLFMAMLEPAMLIAEGNKHLAEEAINRAVEVATAAGVEICSVVMLTDAWMSSVDEADMEDLKGLKPSEDPFRKSAISAGLYTFDNTYIDSSIYEITNESVTWLNRVKTSVPSDGEAFFSKIF